MKEYKDLVKYLRKGKKFDAKSKDKIPAIPGIYFVFDKNNNNIVRVGQATNLQERIENHYTGSVNNSSFRKNVKNIQGITNENDLDLFMENNFYFVVVVMPEIISLDAIEKYYINLICDEFGKGNIWNKQIPKDVGYKSYFNKIIVNGLVTDNNLNTIKTTIEKINDKIIKIL